MAVDKPYQPVKYNFPKRPFGKKKVVSHALECFLTAIIETIFCAFLGH